MKKTILLSLALLTIALFTTSSKPEGGGEYITRTGHVWFVSKASAETIEAHNKQVSSILKTSTGDLVFSVVMKSFEFEKALMQEHFNEKYLETDKFPKATLKGKITNLSAINFGKDGKYTAEVEGDLTLHGVTKKIKEKGDITIKGGTINAKADLKLAIADFNITVPAVVKDKIAKTVDVNLDLDYKVK